MKESELVRSIRELLTILKWNGTISWWERLNSGQILKQAGPVRYMVQLCQTGTPDFIVCWRRPYTYGKCRHTIVDFLECKTAKGKQTPEQKEFENSCNFPECWANYYVIRDLDEVVKLYGGDTCK